MVQTFLKKHQLKSHVLKIEWQTRYWQKSVGTKGEGKSYPTFPTFNIVSVVCMYGLNRKIKAIDIHRKYILCHHGGHPPPLLLPWALGSTSTSLRLSTLFAATDGFTVMLCPTRIPASTKCFHKLEKKVGVIFLEWEQGWSEGFCLGNWPQIRKRNGRAFPQVYPSNIRLLWFMIDLCQNVYITTY